MKYRLIAALLACALLLGGAACADGGSALSAGQMSVFTDCVVNVNEIAWYGDAQSNRLTPAGSGAPSILAIRAQVVNRGMTSRDFALDSSLRVRYGTSFDQTGTVVEESSYVGDGLFFVPSSSILVSPLQAKNIVAYIRVSPLLYYSAAQLEVLFTVGGHIMTIDLGSGAQGQTGTVTPDPWQGGGPIVVNPPSSITPTPVIQPQTRVQITSLDTGSRLLANPAYLDVPAGGVAAYTVPDIPGYTYDHYRCLQNGQWRDDYGRIIAVYSDPSGSVDKEQIVLIYRYAQATVVTPTPAPAVTRQIVRPTGWDTQFRPGISTAPNGEGHNANVYRSLSRLYDDNASTSVSWLLYVSERTDGIPEFTASFNNATISAIGVRNGKVTSESEYFANARLASLHLRIHTSDGSSLNTWVYLPDEYHPEYQVLQLERTYTNVTSVELWIEGNVNQGFYVGTGDTIYTIHITDVQFYHGYATATPTQNPYNGIGDSY